MPKILTLKENDYWWRFVLFYRIKGPYLDIAIICVISINIRFITRINHPIFEPELIFTVTRFMSKFFWDFLLHTL